MEFQGNKLHLTVFGQSHAPAVGMVLDGLPSGFAVDMEKLQSFLARRAPGQSRFTTARKEADIPEFVSGLTEGVACGAPVCALIRNGDKRSADYARFFSVPRPSHADYPARVRYGNAYDFRGGGPFSRLVCAEPDLPHPEVPSRAVDLQDGAFHPLPSVNAHGLLHPRAAGEVRHHALLHGAGVRHTLQHDGIPGVEDLPPVTHLRPQAVLGEHRLHTLALHGRS